MVNEKDLASVREAQSKVDEAYQAWLAYRKFSQEQIDTIVEAVASAARAAARRLAELAVAETGMGNVEDKLAKNMLSGDLLPRAIRGMKTIGVLRELPEQRITEIGVPQGVIAAICPTTNPTSTVIYKTILALKSGNAIVLSPHPRARQCTCETAALMAAAATAAGAPEGLIQCVTGSTLESTGALMKHPKTAVILATGGAGMVRAAYSSGKPAFGVGPGNVPVLVDASAEIPAAVERIVSGKKFDYGTVCSSEQTLVAERSLRDRILAELARQRAFLMNDEQRRAVERTLFAHGTTVSAECVGQSPQKIAQLAGITVPADATILCAEIHGVGKEHPLSAEKLSPVLALLFTPCFDTALDACEAILQFGGLGHTSAIHAQDEAQVRRFGLRMPSFRVLVNTGSPQGSVGITTALQPAMTLGCGAIAGNITSDNIGPLHLVNIKRIAWAVRTVETAMAPEAKPASADKSALLSAVERHLAGCGITLSPAVAAPAAKSCGCGTKPAEAPPAATTPVAQPAPAPLKIAAFVCEDDVRTAIQNKKKIFIGPRTIVTPAARDLAAADEILVMAER
ncbi:MAG: aldehyde dehydrogenase family protein [Bryobacterales bacterium]|nr:aldehyde dehydrogenase family protein [Bryobacterales bacterium]